MNRRTFLCVFTGALAVPFPVEAQQAAKIPRIGYLANRLAANPDQQEAFLRGLRDLGYIDGRNVVIEYRDAEGKLDRLPALAAQLVALKVDVIVAAAGTLPALAAKQASGTVPIVFIAVGNPVTSGLVTSLARPGGNLTGLSALTPELASKWLELLKQAVPGVTRVAVLWQPGGLGDTDKEVLKQADVAARALGVRLQLVEARGPADINRAFSEMTRAPSEALTVVSTPMFGDERRRLTRPVEQLAIPARVQAILAARVDRLAPETKRLLQAAAVIGKDVPMPLLLAIAEAPAHEVRAELTRLQAGEFLYETRLFPELEYTFKHALIHEVAYGGLLRDRQRPLIAHCHLGLGKLYQRTGKREQAQEHLTTATTMYREMGMTYWLEQAEVEIANLR